MKTKELRGMRDIPTIQGLRHRSLPGNREQTMAEIARLEHEKARLEREMRIWLGNQERTEKRIRQVGERLAALQDTLEPPAEAGAQKRAERDRRQRGSADASDGQDQGWQEVPLEY